MCTSEHKPLRRAAPGQVGSSEGRRRARATKRAPPRTRRSRSLQLRPLRAVSIRTAKNPGSRNSGTSIHLYGMHPNNSVVSSKTCVEAPNSRFLLCRSVCTQFGSRECRAQPIVQKGIRPVLFKCSATAADHQNWDLNPGSLKPGT